MNTHVVSVSLFVSCILCCFSSLIRAAEPQETLTNATSLAFEIQEFKTTIDKFSFRGRGLVRITNAQYKNRIISLRVEYTIRFKNSPLSHPNKTWVTLIDGAGIIETIDFLPDAVFDALKEEKDFPIFSWSVEGWSFLNPGTVTVR